MNSIQSPQILSDLYRDLRDRRLLPLVVVLVVGMAVVPIALSSSPETTPAPLPPAPVAAKSNAPTESVVVANPGLRDYKKRLAGDAPKDPFIQQFLTPSNTGSATAAGAVSSSTGEASPAGTDTTTSGGNGTGTTGSSGTGSSGGTTTSSPQSQAQPKYFFYRPTVRAGKLTERLKTYDSVGSWTPLPSKKVPAVTFLGVNTDNAFQAKAAVFLVSSAVSSADGEGSCSYAGSACQLLTLKPGQHEDLVWVDGSVYRIDLVKFNLIARNGAPSTGKKESGSRGRDSGSAAPSGRYFSF